MKLIAQAAGEVYNGDLLCGAIELSCVMHFARPKSHYGTGRNAGRLKASAPARHTQAPDAGKVMRAVEDSLTGVVYRDDRQICRYGRVEKIWTTGQECAEIMVRELSDACD